jgi:DNA-binding HxlR family transcriptional regulator
VIKIKNKRSTCPVSTALEIIGDQWSLIIVRDLFLERTTFSDFRNSPEKISTNILSNRLRKLQDLDLISYVP